MSKAEILQELPNLKPEERQELLERLWDLTEQDVVRGISPTAEERALLDRELDDYHKSPNAGTPWNEVKKKLGSVR